MERRTGGGEGRGGVRRRRGALAEVGLRGGAADANGQTLLKLLVEAETRPDSDEEEWSYDGADPACRHLAKVAPELA